MIIDTTINDIIKFFSNREIIKSSAFQGDLKIKRPAPIYDTKAGDICFCGTTAINPLELLSNVNASLIILDKNITIDYNALFALDVQAIILSENARLDFIHVMENFFKSKTLTGIHSSSVVSPTALIDPDVYIGPLCSIGDDVEIKAGTYIHSGVHIYERVRVGQNVIINSGTVVGADGFGYERNNLGILEKFPHVGSVVIEDDVEIGSNSCIDRGTLGNTVICQGARIDNLVHISHNVIVGKHTAVIANAMVGGGTQVGDYSWIAPSACLRDRITIGAHSVIGLASVVTKNIPDNVTCIGSPARELKDQKKLLSHWNEVVKK